jgi:hypothetical protein
MINGNKKVKKQKNTLTKNKEKLVAIFCHQVAAWLPDLFCKFYLVKNHKVAKNSTTTRARGKFCKGLESLEF